MEFDLIQKYFVPLSQATNMDLDDLFIGDDGALVTPVADAQLVIVTDTLVEGIHFPVGSASYDIGWKALAVNLSDLAAMGAKPAFYSLALTLPQVDQAWLNGLAQGLADCASPYSIPLIGGDTTRGPLTLTVTAQGWVPKGRALLRKGAKAGEGIFVTGFIGEAGRGLSLALAGKGGDNPADLSSLNRLNRPVPRVGLGCALVGVASSAIDVSDGLLADLNHILVASKVGANLKSTDIPLSKPVQEWAGDEPLKPLCAGDDYELCFTASLDKVDQLYVLAEQQGVKLSQIGLISQQPGLLVDGVPLDMKKTGYNHFSG
ncbi:thiamine-phosphate kinase [Thiomicrospira microaerophila]|uniref:thiamine-phosphate kinase n=1 Tax=Thiomicrospira microaerophila TaxID=406020 RepID=UPI00200BACC3|nr:thiamine-phosphate kinase [Thiomicrospira microaerophila]UQB41477.1 thiamine-phosphate kinase [Thiomicrospira microaerophila]